MNDRSYYMPKTFYINFRSGLLDKNGIPMPSEMPVFLHEVSHLVQDQSTISAVIDFIGFLDRVQDLRNLILSGANTLPLRAHDAAKTTWSAVLDDWELLRFASKLWPDRSVPLAFDSYEIVQKSCQLLGEERLYPVAIAHFIDNVSNTTIEQPIGIREIKEAYAVAVERLHGALEPDLFSTEFQYVALERILAQFGEVSPRQTIAICHWALQGIFPGARFFELVEELKRKLHGSSLGCDEEWFDVLRNFSISDFQDKRKDVEQCLAKFIAHYEQESPDDPLVVTLRWYNRVIQQRFDVIESLSRRFPIDTFLGEEHELWDSNTASDGLIAFLQDHPLPLIEDGAGNLYCYGESAEAERGVFVLRAMFHVYEKLWRGSEKGWGCPFIESCSTNEVPHKDSSCRSEARLKGMVKPFCVYGMGAFYVDAHNLAS